MQTIAKHHYAHFGGFGVVIEGGGSDPRKVKEALSGIFGKFSRDEKPAEPPPPPALICTNMCRPNSVGKHLKSVVTTHVLDLTLSCFSCRNRCSLFQGPTITALQAHTRCRQANRDSWCVLFTLVLLAKGVKHARSLWHISSAFHTVVFSCVLVLEFSTISLW